MAGLRYEDFSGRIGEGYEIVIEEHRVPVSLHAAEELARSVREEGSFRLEWLGPRDPLLPQATYAFRRGEEEEFEMFIVPVSRDDQGVVYEAVFA
jgi:hypothetical protein